MWRLSLTHNMCSEHALTHRELNSKKTAIMSSSMVEHSPGLREVGGSNPGTTRSISFLL